MLELWFLTLIILYADDTPLVVIDIPIHGFESQAHCFAFSDGMDIETYDDDYTVMVSCQPYQGTAR